MKTIVLFAIVMLAVVGVSAAALPSLTAVSQPAHSGSSVMSISPELVQPVFLACDGGPCDCPNC